MKTVTVQMAVPESMAPFLKDMEEDISLERNAMILHPYIQRGMISHGRAAEILGMKKWDLIEFYNSLGIPYLNQSKEELLSDLKTFDRIREKKQ